MAFSIVIDGHNFINDLERFGKDKTYISSQLSFPILHIIIQRRLQIEGLYSHPFIHTEFVCSDRGPIGSLKGGERDNLIKKLRNEKGVTVLEVPQHTEKQKGVDFTVFIRMMTLARTPAQPHEIVLFASDTDYIPAMRLMAEMGTHVVIVGFMKNGPILNEGLVNESYLSLDLEQLLQQMETFQISSGSSGSPINPAPAEP
ncbi:MAG: NYN domain-containing protein [Deltaproteobacteria bacterium]|nr:NYN domain-containing protein [Deltaproteobacteria bacterium]